MITDFNANAAAEDLDLSAVTAITDFQDLVDNHLIDMGDHAVIKVGANSITLLGVDIAKLDDSDFLF